MVGYLKRSGDTIMLKVDSAYNDYVHQKNYKTKSLKGIVQERNEDSLFIKFFPFTKDLVKANPAYVNSSDEDGLYVLKINDWKISGRSNKVKDIPYRNTQVTAVNFPLRINLSDGTIEAGLSNVAVSVTRIRGLARIYKSSELYETRYRYWGYGLMVGMGSRKNSNDKDEFAINYGLSLIGSIYGVKLIVASGLENGFKSTSKKASFFIGFGFGVDIYSLVNPEIKKKE